MKMRKLYAGLVTALLCITANLLVAQQAEIKLSWYPIADTINNTIKVEVTNVSENPLTADEWAIYFNASRMFRISGNSHLSGKMLNGFLFEITPDAEFKPLQPGEKMTFALESKDRVLNVSDGPAGLYFVNEKTGRRTLLQAEIPGDAIARFMEGNPGTFETPLTIYQQNERIEKFPSNKLRKIFPTPVRYEEKKGNFVFSKLIRIDSDTTFEDEQKFLISQLRGLGFKVNTGGQSSKQILLRYKKMSDEAYELSTKNHQILIGAGSKTGMFYGIQSLLTLLPPSIFDNKSTQKTFVLPEVKVIDTPRYHYRGVMLDVARNFQPKNEIKKVLEVMALYKLNVLHFHLNDDEGWRLAIPGLPELTDVGSHRGHRTGNEEYLPPAFGSGPDTSKGSGNGHYTREDFIELLRFANDRHITIIPEIESPGHARAAIFSMASRYKRLMAQNKSAEASEFLLRVPDTTVTKDSNVVTWWTDNVMDIKLPSTYRFVEKVTDEIEKMYDDAGLQLKTIHMGGDEVAPESMNYDGAGGGWLYFWTKIDSVFRKKGLMLSGWEEMAKTTTGEGGTEPHLLNQKLANDGYTFDVWNNVVGKDADLMGYHLANEGFKIVLSCARNNYFDMAYSKYFSESGYYWAGFTDVEKTFSFVPHRYNVQIDEERINKRDKLTFTPIGKSNIRGLKGLLWAEKITSGNDMEYKLFPRLLALAERAWAIDPVWADETKPVDELKPSYDSAWSDFVNRISKRELPRLDHFADGIYYRIPPPGIKIDNRKIIANLEYPGYVLRYTTDGSEPNARSKEYKVPLQLKGTFKFKAFNSKGRSGRTSSITYK